MQKDIDGHTLAIQGFTHIQVADPDALLHGLRTRFPELELQLFRADRIAGREHLIFAAVEAISAFRQHRQRSHTLAVELLLYASCQRQISKAIQLLGFTSNTHEAVLATITNNGPAPNLEERMEEALKAKRDDSVIEVSSKDKISELLRAYEISRKSMSSAQLPGEARASVLKRLIIERSALLAVEKQ